LKNFPAIIAWGIPAGNFRPEKSQTKKTGHKNFDRKNFRKRKILKPEKFGVKKFGKNSWMVRTIAALGPDSSGNIAPNHNFPWNPHELKIRGVVWRCWWAPLSDGDSRKGIGYGRGSDMIRGTNSRKSGTNSPFFRSFPTEKKGRK